MSSCLLHLRVLLFELLMLFPSFISGDGVILKDGELRNARLLLSFHGHLCVGCVSLCNKARDRSSEDTHWREQAKRKRFPLFLSHWQQESYIPAAAAALPDAFSVMIFSAIASFHFLLSA